MPAESPAMVFATPTKVVSEAGAGVEYMGANKVPDFQRLFQVMINKDCNKRNLNHDTYTILTVSQLLLNQKSPQSDLLKWPPHGSD